MLSFTSSADTIVFRVPISNEEPSETGPYFRFGRIFLDDGTVLEADDVTPLVVVPEPEPIEGTAGDDDLAGTGGDDVIDALDGNDRVFAGEGYDQITGGLGNDVLAGEEGGDDYFFGRGDGNDVIADRSIVEDGEPIETNTLHLFGYTAAELVFTLDAIEPVITLTFTTSGDSIAFRPFFGSGWPGPGNLFFFGDILLDDGTVLTGADISALVVTPEVDERYGTEADDVFENDSANTYFEDDLGSDTFIYGRGDGSDVIYDLGTRLGDVDRLVFTDINIADLAAIVDIGAGDYLFRIAESTPGAGDASKLIVWVADEGPIFDPETEEEISAQGVEAIEFADGTIWTLSDVIDHLTDEGGGGPGGGDDDPVVAPATPGNDYYEGSYRIDIIELGRGDDIARGDGGLDQFIYNRGDGHDIYHQYTYGGDKSGFLDLNDILASEVTVTRRFEHIVLSVTARAVDGSDAGSVILADAAGDENAWRDVVIRFDDGSEWRAAEISARLLAADQTAGDDYVVGLPLDDLFNPGAGNDLIEGVSGNDTIRYARGDGHDIVASQDNAGRFVLRLDSVAPGAVEVLRHGNDLILNFADEPAGAGNGGSIRFLEGYYTAGYGRMAVSSIVFDDGTAWGEAEIAGDWLAPRTTEGADHVVNAGPGLTYEMGGGDDYVETGAVGDTYIYRNGDGHDTIVENGSMEYLGYRRRGDVEGTEFIQTDEPGTDIVDFADFDPSRITFRRFGDDLVADIAADAGAGIVAGSVTIAAAFASRPDRETRVEVVRFGDDSERLVSDIIAGIVAAQATDGNDDIIGTGGNDVLAGGLGNDTLVGQGARDTYVYRRGDGEDIVIDREGRGLGSELRLEGIDRDDVVFRAVYDGVLVDIAESAPGAGDGGSVLIDGLFGISSSSPKGVASVRFDDGTIVTSSEVQALILQAAGSEFDDIISGDGDDDVIEGRGGNDYLIGEAGADTYLYSRGDGYDVIVDSGYWDNDRIVLRNIASEDVMIRQGHNNDLEILIVESADGAGDAGRITVRNSFAANQGDGIQRIVFDDGTEWTRDMFETLVARNVATAGDDSLSGTSGGDRLEGLAGDDFLSGGAGDDTYVFTRGDGRDTVRDVGAGGVDTIEIAGYADSEVTFTRRGRNGQDLIIRLGDGSEQIAIVNAFNGSWADSIERVVLTDSGRVFEWGDIESSLVLGNPSASDDQIIGTEANDTIRAGAGADLVMGRGGNDTYLYRAGDGDDRITDGANSVGDRLLLEDIASTGVVWARRSPADGDDLVLRFAGAQDRIVLTDSLSTSGTGIEKIVFSDGVEWNVTQMRAAVMRHAATAEGETIRGFDGAELVVGGRGDDFMTGGEGNDTYRFAEGDGNDIIEDNGTTSADRLEIGNLLSLEATVKRLYKGSDTIVISFASTADTITIRDALSTSGRGIEQIAFADGVTWNRAKILDLLDNNAPVTVNDGIYTVKMEQELRFDPATLLRNDYDADGDGLSIIAVDGGEHGTAQIGANGTIIFTGRAGFTGATKFTYTVSDGRNGLSTATVDVRVTPPASARDDIGFVVNEDASLQIDVLRLLSNDIDGDRMIVAQVFDAVNGTVSLSSDGQIGFTPTANFHGLASFRYVANTPEGGRAEATVYIDVLPANDAPDARNDVGFVTNEDTAFEIDPAMLLGNDTDIDGDALTVTAVVGNANVHVELTDDGVILVTPAPFFFGQTTFTYVVTDANGATDTATVRIDVTPVNNAPEPAPDTLTIDEDEPILIAAADLLANDVERDGDPLHIASVRRGTGGNVQLNENQTVLFTPSGNFFGQAHFFYTVNDGQGGLIETRVDVQVNPINDAPNARDESYRSSGVFFLDGVEDVPLVISTADLLRNDSDIDGLNLTVQSIAYSENGTAELRPDGTIVFTANANYWGEATFRYVVADEGGLVDDATVTVYFAPVGDAPPVAANDTIYVYEDVPTVIPVAALLGNDTDIDRDELQLLSVSMGFNRHGSVAFNENGDIVFTPGLNRTDGSEFSYVVTDNADGTDSARVSIVIIAVNDAPTAAPDTGSTSLDAPLVLRISDLLANDSDVDLRPVDYDLLEFVGVRFASNGGAVSIYNDEFVVVEYARGFSGTTTVEYTIQDPEGVEDDGTVHAVVSATHAATLSGTAIRDLLIATHLGERIEGLGGDDDIFAREGDDYIVGGDGADRTDGGEGFDTVDFAGSNIGVRADLAARIGQGGHAQGDVYFSIESLVGTTFADELAGDSKDNLLKGLGGNDLLSGREGVDTLQGGQGNDRLDGGVGGDILDGGEGSDTADYFFSAAAVQISLAAGTAAAGDAAGDTLISIENVIGTDHDDVLEGDGDDNRLNGGRGNDRIVGGAGNDVLIGGRGADELIGGDGIDQADYSISAEGVTVNMANASAGGGDALGDTFTSIELVIGSFHNDTIIGDAGDNVIRGGRGADAIDGGGGFDIADYSTADEGVGVDLGSGQGTTGEALGDTLAGIEKLVGSAYQDNLAGGSGDDVFDGGFEDDLLAGRAGSDSYLFGFDSGEDTIIENGAAADTDRIVLGAGVRVRDLSVIRQGDDLLLELEHDDGLLIDTVRVVDHFDGRETGLEEVVFADGTVWDRDDIDFLQRNGRFNAVDDIIRFADEDVPLIIMPHRLTANDATEATELLTIVSVDNAVNGTATLLADGSVRFIGAQDFNGDAFFDYTVRDQHGRESTARAEVNVLPINDAPVAHDDGVFTGIEDNVLFISYEDLFGNDFDFDGDDLEVTSVGPLYGPDGQPLYQNLPGAASNGIAFAGGDGIYFDPDANHYGFAGFTYTISDPSGETSTASVELNFVGVNDAPFAEDDSATARLGLTKTIYVRDLLANDRDIEGDDFSFVGIRSVTNGTASVRTIIEGGEPVQVIDFDGAGLGDASFLYDVVDEHGAQSSAMVNIDVIPLNDPPNARNDSGFETLEDQIIVIEPAALLANDSDPNNDTLTIIELERFPLNGKVRFNEDGMIEFTPRADYNGQAGFNYTISDGRGGSDTAFVSIAILVDNDAPVVHDDVLDGIEDVPIVVLAAEAFANDMDPEGDVIFFEDAVFRGILNDDFSNRTLHEETVDLASPLVDAGVSVAALLADGSALPDWLVFDAATLTFTGVPPVGVVDPFDVVLTFSDVDPRTGDPVTYQGRMSIDPADGEALADGVAYDANLMAVSLGEGSWSASLPSGRPLPDWLSFNAETMRIERTGIEPDPDESIARVRVHFQPDNPNAEGFAIEFRIDPNGPVDPGINALLANPAFFASNGLWVLPIATDAEVTASKANGIDLPSWLSFDAETLSFRGTPPEKYVGAIPVRIDIGASTIAGTPAFALIRDVVIDETYDLGGGGGFSVTATGERIYVSTPEDFNGAFVIEYTARDEKGAVSEEPARIVINVAPQRERPDPRNDTFDTVEDTPVTIALSDLLANDVDDDGDPVRVVSIGTPARGTLTVNIPELSVDLPPVSGLGAGPITHTATLAGGGALPSWLSVDPETGRLFGTPPLAARETLSIVVRSTDGVDTIDTVMSIAVDGNAGVTLTYQPEAQHSGQVIFGYAVTDDREGAASAQVRINVAPFNDPPVARDDVVGALEDEVLLIDPATLLANDSDVDGDSLRILSVFNAVNGSVELVDGVIRFTPTDNFDGEAFFEYIVTDDTDGVDIGRVRVNVASTNDRPVAVTDTFQDVEDIPVIVTIAELLSNDYDPDGDEIEFVGVDQNGDGGQAFILPGGRVSLVPRDNINGPVTFTYRITDGRLGSTETRNIVVDFAAVNDAPVVEDDGVYTTAEDQPVSVDLAELLANDSDVEYDALTVVSVLDPVNGSVRMENGRAIFTPRADYFGNAGFSYVVSDGNGGLTTGFVSISVLPGQDMPIAVSDTGWTIDEDTYIDIDPAELIANDVDPDGGAISFVRAFGSGVQELPNGMIRFTPVADGNGQFSFNYVISNGASPEVVGTVHVAVRPVDDDPTAVDDSVDGVEDQPLVIPLLSLRNNDSDADGHATAITSVGNAVGGNVAFDGVGNVVFTPTANRNGPASFDYVLTDITGATDTATVTIDLQPVNDAPTIAPIAPLPGVEDERFAAQLPASAFADLDGDPLTVSVRLANGDPLPDWLVYHPDARGLVGQPPADFNGTMDLEVIASDGTATARRVVQIAIAAVNDAPVATDDVVEGLEDQTTVISVQTLLGNDVDVDGDTLDIVSVSAGPGATATLDGFGNVVVTRGQNAIGDVEIEYTVSDGQRTDVGKVVVSATPVNDAPVVGPLANRHSAEDTAIDFALPADWATDVDGDALTIAATRASGTALPAWLSFDAATRRFTGTPPADFHGTIALKVTASDGSLSASSTFNLVIDPVNDAPRILAPFSDRFVDEDEAFNIVLQQNLFTDVDGDALSYSITRADGTALPSWLVAQPEFLRLSGRPPADFNGVIDLRVTASDGELTMSDVFKFTVNPVNDAPVLAHPLPDVSTNAAGQPLKTGSGFSVTIPAGTFTDPDGDTLMLAARLANGSALPSWMQFDGSKLTGTPPHNAAGTWNIRVLANDGSLTNSDVFAITFQQGNAAPVVRDDGRFNVYVPNPLTIDADVLLANDTDADDDMLSIVAVGQGAHGTVTLANNQVVYQAANGYAGDDQFTYTVSDGKTTTTGKVLVKVDTTYAGYHQGTSGDDTLFGGFGSGSIFGGDGDDTLIAGLFGGNLAGGRGNDTLIGLLGNNRLDGNEGDDRLIGGIGRDTLAGGTGDDELTGGLGRDTFIFRDGDGSDTVTDFDAGRRTRFFFIAGDGISIDVTGIDNFQDMMSHAQQTDDGVLFAFGNGDELFLRGTQLAALDSDSFTFF